MSPSLSPKSTLPVCVIGGGAAGIASAMEMKRNDVRFVVLEQRSGVGGLWRDSSSPPLYDGLRTNLPAGVMAFREHPFPAKKPDAATVQKYLQGVFQKEFVNTDTDRDFRFNTRVVSTEWNDDQWVIKIAKQLQEGLKEEETQILKFRALVVATGHYSKPNHVEIKGSKSFPNQIIHSKDFHSAALYRQQKVLIVGGLGSGRDIAGLLADQQQQTSSSDWVHVSLRASKQTTRDAPEFVMQAIHRKAKEGGAVYHPGVRELLGDGSVVFEDGTTLPNVDTIILATGYLFAFPFLSDSIQKRLLARQGEDPTDGWRVRGLFGRVWAAFPLSEKGSSDNGAALSFVGLPNGLLSPWILFSFQARWIARVHAKKSVLPETPEMMQESQAEEKTICGRDSLWLNTGRYCNDVAWHAWNKRVPLTEGYWYWFWTCCIWRVLGALLWGGHYKRTEREHNGSKRKTS